MASATKHSRIAEHAARADASLSAGKVFDAESHALKALMLARQDLDFDRMVSIIPALLECRMRRLRDATKGTRTVTLITTPIGEDVQVKKGCYLVQPPQVGADARRLRLAALERGVCAAVLCREPLTQVKLVPIVAISPGTTIRTQVRPPKTLDKPDLAWFSATLEALGDCAATSLDADMLPQRRVDALLERLDAIPEHEGLHEALKQACIDASKAAADADAARAAKKAQQVARAQPPTSDVLDEADEDKDEDVEDDEVAISDDALGAEEGSDVA